MNHNTRWLLPALLLTLTLIALAAGCAPAVPAASDLPALVSPQDAQSRLQSAPDTTVLLDVRTNEEWANDGRAAGATLIPLDQLSARVGELSKDDTIIVVCRSGNRSQTAAEYLRSAGFTHVSEVEGGMRNWVAAGLPIECDVATCGLAQ